MQNCSEDQALKRIALLFSSHELDGLMPTDAEFQRIVDRHMETPVE